MFAGTWVSTDEPANKLVFESDVAQASIRIKSDWWPIKFLFYGDKCKWTVSNLNFGPYELEGAGPAPFTGLYSWYDEAMDTTRFITVKFSGRTLWMRQAEDDPLSGTTNTYRYVLSDDGQSISYESSNYSPALTAHTSSGVYTRQ